MKNVMKKAWEIAYKGQTKFGGKVKEYFAQALKMAWVIVKEEEMNVITFKKGGAEFSFRNFKVDSYESVVCEWKVVGLKENDENDGYYFNATWDKRVEALRFNFTDNQGRKMSGVKPVEEYKKKIEVLAEKLISEYNEEKTSLIKAVENGDIPIRFSIVGVDFPYFQAWLDDIDKKFCVQKIMEEAIANLSGESFISNSCDWIKRIIDPTIGSVDKMPDGAFGFEYKEKTQDYHGYERDVVTNFYMRLEDIVNIWKKKEDERKARIEARENPIFEKARLTGKAQVLSRYSVDCNDPNEDCDIDNIVTYALPDGSTITERHHTW